MDGIHPRRGAKVLFNAPKYPALASDCSGRVIGGFLLEIEISNLLKGEFAEAGPRAVEFLKMLLGLLQELQTKHRGLLRICRLR